MKTNRFIIPIIIFIISPVYLVAQQGKGQTMNTEQREKIETQRIAFITDKLELTPEEAEKFWPVYNEHKKNMDVEKDEFRKKRLNDPEKILGMTDDEASQIIQDQFKHEQKMLDMRKSFHLKVADILSPQKALRLVEVEKEFRVELMHRVAGREQRMHRSRNR
jgi:hypothetical protein